MKHYKIYTDGACSNNKTGEGVGGTAFVRIDENEKIIYEQSTHWIGTTNNICELNAVINACLYAKEIPDAVFDIIMDSAYIYNCYTQNWYKSWQSNGWLTSKKTSVLNKELWELLIPFFNDIRFNFIKTKGHSTDKWNNYVDKLAVTAKEGR